MADINKLSAFILDSIYTPLLIQDPSYIAVTTKISAIITQKAAELGYTVALLPQSSEETLILLVKKELYMRLATARAPEFDVESQYTKILQSDRFDHYMKLLQFVQKDIDQLIKSGKFNTVQVADVIISGREGTAYNYNKSQPQLGSISVSNITATTADVDWTIFDTDIGNFNQYQIYYSTQQFYDEYAETVLDETLVDSGILTILDIKRTKYRISNLTTNTKYYIAIVYHSLSGSRDIFQTEFTTL
jgi:hypothetical protein